MGVQVQIRESKKQLPFQILSIYYIHILSDCWPNKPPKKNS